MSIILGDGIEHFKRYAAPEMVAHLLEECCVWVHPDSFHLLPIWAPYAYRKAPLYKKDWVERHTNKGVPRFETNAAAANALNRYLGITKRNRDVRPNWTCCHIWGNDDESYQSDWSEVNDPRYFTCPANMVLVPSPLKTFTDTIPEVKAALRFASFVLYGFVPDGHDEPDPSAAGKFLPSKWQSVANISVSPSPPNHKSNMVGRLKTLIDLQNHAGAAYPRKQVLDCIRYWRAKCPESLLDQWEVS